MNTELSERELRPELGRWAVTARLRKPEEAPACRTRGRRARAVTSVFVGDVCERKVAGGPFTRYGVGWMGKADAVSPPSFFS